MKRVCACLVLGLVALSGGCPQPDDTSVPDPTNLDLMNQAEGLVQADYPRALLIEQNGAPSSGSAMTAANIDSWLFVFVDDIEAETPGTVLLVYAGGRFRDPVRMEQTWTGTVYERLPRVLTLEAAVALMRAAGYPDAFTAVSLRKAAADPQPAEAQYAFAQAERFVLVGARTGTVSEEVR